MDTLPSFYVFSVALTLMIGLTTGAGVLPDGPLNKTVGGTVKFSTTLPPTGTPFLNIVWRFKGTQILISNTQNKTEPGYEGRVTLFRSTGSLELRNLALNDSGEYSVSITEGVTEHVGETTLQVYEPVRDPKVNVSSTYPEEGSSVSLSCSVSSGSSLSFRWMNDSSEVTASDRVQLTDGGSTLTITPVIRYDHGPYKCNVSNPVSHDTSDPVNLFISYGPENTKLRLSPSQEHFAVGSNISLFCSAHSRPDPHFDWFLNGDEQPGTGPELKLINIQESGNYTCRSFNNKTLRNDTSMQLSVSVLEKISDASVTPSTSQAIEGKSFNLTCDAAGSVFTRKWMKDGLDLTLNDNITLYEENRVLSFQSLQKTDTGEYSCNISNPISSMEVKYSLVVKYGPENVEIKGQNEIHVGETITLTCSAESEPTANYTWSLNGTEIHKSFEYAKEKAEDSDSGNYTCRAKNDITGRSLSAVHKLKVTAFIPTPPASCSAGCIAGIVIACLVVIGAAAGVGYYFYRKKKGQGKSSSLGVGGGGQNNRAFTHNTESSGNKELNYAEVTVFRNRNDGEVRLRPQDETSEYAQVKGNNAATSPPTYDVHMKNTKRQAPLPAADGAQVYAQARKN